MKYLKFYSILILTILPLFGCQKTIKSTKQIDNKSYINDFELIQENPNNQTNIIITSPKAIIDSTKNDIEIFDSLIEIVNKNGQDFKIESGNSSINNLSNSIQVFNDVNISFINKPDYYITTDSFIWDLNTYVIDINDPLKLNIKDTNIIASSGFYNIESSILKINNAKFNRKIYNSNDKQEYHVEIKSDVAKWFKNDNTLEFISNEEQVETTINFLITE